MPRAYYALIVASLAMGCGQEPVREDRAADWERSGDTVAFQHDKEGVYVADKEGTELARIFQPDESVLATSRPIHSPTDGRLIFTTAHDPAGQPEPPAPIGIATPPEGSVAWQRPVKYTCWLRDEPAGDEQPAPRQLFTARCEHIGYVSAGLAVRWHPDGDRILFVDSTPNSNARHGVYEFHLKSGKTRSVFPHRADALIFDFTPGGSRLVCVAGSMPSQTPDSTPTRSVAGIWIGDPDDGKSWWKLSGSERLAAGDLPSLIESLRASRPAWTLDDSHFASVGSAPDRAGDEDGMSRLRITHVARRETRTVYESDGLLADLAWSPDGGKLGFVERPPAGDAHLRIYERDGQITGPIERRPVRKFAGFDGSGTRLAYVVADDSGLPDGSQNWALVLRPDRTARDVVVVAQTADTATGAEVFSGMRVTFPVWSPKENRLALWITFVPRYQSLLSILRRWGLLPGDPAATLDLATGEVSWLAVTPSEELQVGHYYLLKKEFARAWEWYARAGAKLPPRKPPRDFQEFTQTIGAPERSQLFESYCLEQLGRHDEAQLRLADFEQNFFPAEPAAGEPAESNVDGIFRQFGPQGRLLKRLIHDLYAAEVFLSVDAPDAAIAYLRERRESDDDMNQLSRALALSQVLPIAGRREEYLSACTDQVLPLALAIWESDGSAKGGTAAGAGHFNNEIVKTLGGLCLAPLFRADFLAGIPDEALRRAIALWEARRMKLDAGDLALAIDLFLRAAHLALDSADKVPEIEARLARNPATRAAFGEKPLDEAIRELFATADTPAPAR